ncbi:MAG TPA: hypothetical protein VGP46_11385, partial [Acidimicrobiales bacterium]|nr:hypothetical protein [Acidimicrobiales bacterium]
HAGVDDGVGDRLAEMGLARTARDSDRLQHLRRLLPCEVRVTSTIHPLYGQLLRATSFRRYQQVPYLVVVLPDGSPGTIPVAATDILGDGQPPEMTAVLSVEGTRRLRALLGTLKPARRVPAGSKTRK